MSQQKEKIANNKCVNATKAATSIDVAKRAGVSQTSVSRVFNRQWNDKVSEAVREKVLRAAEELGYTPNAIARGLIIRKTGIIGVVLSDQFSAFYHQMLNDLTNAFQQHDMRIMVFNVAPESDINQIITRLNQYQVDGVIITSAALTNTMSNHWIQNGLPLVVLNTYIPEAVCSCVYCDNFEVTAKMARHLYEIGRRRFAYVSSANSRYLDHQQRRAGFLHGLADLGISDCTVVDGDFSYESGRAGGRALFHSAAPPDAVFCGGELMAIGVMDVARQEFGLRIPEDVAVAGYEDSFAASLESYRLTAVRQPMEKMVADTVELMREQISQNTFIPRSIRESGDLIIRESTVKKVRD